MWLGDDFHHNGAFRLSYGLEYAYMMESSKEITDVDEDHRSLRRLRVVFELGPLSNATLNTFKGGCRAGTTSSIIRITTRSGNDRALSRG